MDKLVMCPACWRMPSLPTNGEYQLTAAPDILGGLTGPSRTAVTSLVAKPPGLPTSRNHVNLVKDI